MGGEKGEGADSMTTPTKGTESELSEGQKSDDLWVPPMHIRKLERQFTLPNGAKKRLFKPVLSRNFNNKPYNFWNEKDALKNNIVASRQKNYEKLLTAYTRLLYSNNNNEKDLNTATELIENGKFSTEDFELMEELALKRSIQNAPTFNKIGEKQNSRRNSISQTLEDAYAKEEAKNEQNELLMEGFGGMMMTDSPFDGFMMMDSPMKSVDNDKKL